jgi:hypothetical protein
VRSGDACISAIQADYKSILDIEAGLERIEFWESGCRNNTIPSQKRRAELCNSQEYRYRILEFYLDAFGDFPPSYVTDYWVGQCTSNSVTLRQIDDYYESLIPPSYLVDCRARIETTFQTLLGRSADRNTRRIYARGCMPQYQQDIQTFQLSERDLRKSLCRSSEMITKVNELYKASRGEEMPKARLNAFTSYCPDYYNVRPLQTLKECLDAQPWVASSLNYKCYMVGVC